MEVEEIYPYLTYPDPFGECMTWEEWIDAVDLYYETEGWDRATGWPYGETWENFGLSDVAQEFAAQGLVPERGNTAYVRKGDPFPYAQRCGQKN